ncbi:MAG: EamA family transporter [bacterium]|nr:MAG: EamA family transporter [bacterium]
MQSWILYSLLGTAIYVIVIFVDKYNLTQQIKDYRGMAMYSAIVGLISGSVLWLMTGRPILGFQDGLLVMITGMLSIFSASIYFYVIQKEDGSKVLFLLQLVPVFVLILSLLFLDEVITIKKLLGFALILIPSLLASSDGNKLKLSIDKNTILLMASTFLTAVSAVIFKFVVDAGSFSKVVAYESWGWAIGGLILFTVFPSVRKAFFTTTKSLKKIALAIVFGNEILFLGSKLLLFLAISLGSVYLVNVITGTQVLFGALFGVVLTLLVPKIFHEDISKNSIKNKLILGVITLVGLGLIY